MEPRILVLLASHNGARWIEAQIDSILRQARVDVHLTVGDDGSTDGTLERLSLYAHTQRVRVHPRAGGSGSAAQNFFSLVRAQTPDGADFVAFADQDDVWYPDKLARACAALAHGDSAGYSSAVTARWPDGRERLTRQARRLTRSDFLFEGAGQGCTFVLTRAFYERIRSFLTAHPQLTQPIHYHDWAIYSLARVWSLGWVLDPSPTMMYRQHRGNDTGARQSLAGVAKRLALIKGGWYHEQLSAIAELCMAASGPSPMISEWHSLLNGRPSWRRRLRIAAFCARGGRRRTTDNLILLAAALLGWI